MKQMSASASKKKRKELEEQGLSAKDVAVKKEKEKKAKFLRNAAIVALCAAVALGAVFAVISLVNRPSYDTDAAAVTVGSEKISVPVYDYFYNLTVTNFYNSYSFLIQSDTPLSQQSNFFGEGSLEDYMKQSTNDSLEEVLNLVAAARAAGYKLSDEDKEEIKTALENARAEAKGYGWPSVDKYLAARYGEGCDLDAYEEYLTLVLLYSGYGTKLNEEFQPTAAELSAAYEASPETYDLVTFTYASTSASSSKVDPDDENNTDTTYTDEAKAEAKATAESYLEEMPETSYTNTYSKDNISSYYNAEIAEWLFDSDRKEGDAKVFARNEKETSFYTVRFDSRDTNDYCLVNANIIAITKDTESTELKEGQQSSEEKHDALLAAIEDGMTDEAFGNAVTALGYSASTTSIAHAYSIEEIKDFLFDAGRKPGDLLTTYETDTTYYVVRFASTNEVTYRDSLVKSKLWNDYYEGIAHTNKIVLDEELLKNAVTDLTFNSSSSTEE